MATTQRSEYLDTATRDLRLNPGIDHLPSDLAPEIQLSYELRPRLLAKSASIVSATSAIVYTGQVGVDLYLVGLAVTLTKDVTAVTNHVTVNGTIDGVATPLFRLNCTTLTIQDLNGGVYFGLPGVKLDAGTNITVTASSATATFRADVSICYYIMSK